MATPALVPGLAHSGSPTDLSTCRESRVLSQSTGCKATAGEERKNSGRSQLTAMSKKYTIWFSSSCELQKEVKKVPRLSPSLRHQKAHASQRHINHGLR